MNNTLKIPAVLSLAAFIAFGSQLAAATSDPLAGIVSAQGGAGLGFATRKEHSPYRGGGMRNDLLPLYLYEGQYAYLHSYRGGLKLYDTDNEHLDVFLAHRFEGFPYDKTPSILAGMMVRASGVDFGTSYQRNEPWGSVYGEYLHDVSGASSGNELRLGYSYDWKSERWLLRPHLMISARDSRLNDYYYGVLPGEATAIRPAYRPGSGVNGQLGLYGAYSLTKRWRLLGGVTATKWMQGVRNSPVVNNRVQMSTVLGLIYDLSPEQTIWPKQNLIVKVMYGKSTGCTLAGIMQLRCASTNTTDQTSIGAIEIGRPFIERLNDWPLDIIGYLGLLHHNERGLQSNFGQVQAYMKAFYYGFPWSDHVRTRLGFGLGISYAQKVPFVEQRDQALQGRNASKLLNYIDPSIDVSVGDLFGVRSLRETYFGLGVSHRSGIFGTSRLLGNVNGGSNYLYSYLEWPM